MQFPIDWVRAQFPALGSGEVFLDNAAGSQVPGSVLLATVEAMLRDQVNKGGFYAASRRVDERVSLERSRCAEFVAAADPAGVVFGPNATTLVTLLAAAFGSVLGAGDEVVVTELDHHANLDPWRSLRRQGVVVRSWRTRPPEHRLVLDDLLPLLSERTALVAMTAASNALGTLAPVPQAAAAVHQVGALLMVDAVHSAPHLLPDAAGWAADMLVFSPYKVFGPHLGVLYLSPEVQTRLPGHRLSFMDEGGRSGFEIGTQSHEAIAGFGGTFEYLDALARRLGSERSGRSAWQLAYQAIGRYERALLGDLLAGLDTLGYERYGLAAADGRTATVSFNHPRLDPSEVAEALAERGVAVACGHCYAYELMYERLALAARGGAVRASLLHYNNKEDVRRLLAALAEL